VVMAAEGGRAMRGAQGVNAVATNVATRGFARETAVAGLAPNVAVLHGPIGRVNPC
jgi:hypothetical protein